MIEDTELLEPELEDIPEDDSAEPDDADVAHEVPADELDES